MSNNTPKQLEKQIEELRIEILDAHEVNLFLGKQLAEKNEIIINQRQRIKKLKETIEELAK